MASRLPKEQWADAAYDLALSKTARSKLTKTLYLDLSQRGSLAKLPPLEGLLHVNRLNLSGTRIENLEGVERLENLLILQLDRTRVRDLRPLAFLTRLAHLEISWTNVDNLAPLASLKSLRSADRLSMNLAIAAIK
jgi:hypothetical protein